MIDEKRPDQELDPEIHALHLLAKALEPLERAARQRVLDYARKRFLDAEASNPLVLRRADGSPMRPITLDDLGLLTNPLKSLKDFMQMEGLADLADFRFVPESLVLRLRGMGDKSLKDFKAALAQVGVILGGDFPRGVPVSEWKARMEAAKITEAADAAEKGEET